jgi:hypothetical protein
VIVAVLASVIGFFFYLRVIVAMYMQEPEGEHLPGPRDRGPVGPGAGGGCHRRLRRPSRPLLELAGDALSR